MPVPEVRGSGGPVTFQSPREMWTRYRFVPSIVDPAAMRTWRPTQAEGSCVTSIAGHAEVAPVETARPPSTGATHQSPCPRSATRAPLKRRKRPSGDQRGPMLLGNIQVPKSGWKGRGGPPSVGTRNIL